MIRLPPVEVDSDPGHSILVYSQYCENASWLCEAAKTVTAPHGHHPYGEIICCLLKQTTITTACNRAREGMRRAVPDVESAQSPDCENGLPWRPPESTPPLAKSFVSGGNCL